MKDTTFRRKREMKVIQRGMEVCYSVEDSVILIDFGGKND